jgi:hypothetical protein
VWWRTYEKGNLDSLLNKNGGKSPVVWRNGQTIEVLQAGKLQGRWRIKSVSNEERDGIIIKLSPPDSEAIVAKPRLTSLLKSGAKLVEEGLCG